MGLAIWSVSSVRTIDVLLPKMVDKRRMNQQNPNVSQGQCGYLRSILIRFSTRPLLGLRQSRLETGNYCCLFPNSVDRKFSNSVVQRPNRLHLQQRRQCVVSQSESAPALKGECTGSISKPHALWEVQEATFFVFQNCVLYIRKTEWKHLTHVFSSGFSLEAIFGAVWTDKHQAMRYQKAQRDTGFPVNWRQEPQIVE